jgi:ABC-2 type transport system ATP-binding protein
MERPALRGVDLEVAAGQVHGIIGPNGSGKTTLLRILSTVVLPDSGSASVFGHDVVAEPLAVRRLIGLSTGEERSVYWRLTARQNLEFAAALYHLSNPNEAICSALELVNLDGDCDRPVSGYSQGMLRRLSLARALIHMPPLLLLDEPTRSLDPAAADHFRSVLARIRDERDVTTILTTHDLGEAASCCDVVSSLQQGRVVGCVVPPEEASPERALRRLVS